MASLRGEGVRGGGGGVENNALRYDSTKGVHLCGTRIVNSSTHFKHKNFHLSQIEPEFSKKKDFVFVLVCCMSLICLQEV